MDSAHVPALESAKSGEIVFFTDEVLATAGVRLAFSTRSGGVSANPFSSLNLAAHVGDDPSVVDENRARFLHAVGLGDRRSRLVTAEQVHGQHVEIVTPDDAGRGAFAVAGRPPVAGTDALITRESGVPLMLFFADCVPVVLVAPGAVALAHAGWRGALAALPGTTASRLAEFAGCKPSDIAAYVGAHIRACHYAVGAEIMSQFVNTFGPFARAQSGGLDLGAVVTASLIDAGVPECNIAGLGLCTAEATDRFFSYRAEAGSTGRHAALVCIL